jgi:hypothetical protein
MATHPRPDGTPRDPGPTGQLDPRLIESLRVRLPEVSVHTIEAVMAEVPPYADAFGGRMGDNIENAVQMALAGFLRLAGRSRTDAGTPLTPAIDGAYALGRGEARSGRSAEALLSAYRVGARVAWRELSATAVEAGAGADELATFAEMVFAYIDELSAASVAGHTDEVESSGRVRQHLRDALGQAIVRGDSAEVLVAAAERADWEPPDTLTAVVLPDAQVRPVLTGVDGRTLHVPDPGLADGLALLLVAGGRRPTLLRGLAGRSAVAGPARPWQLARSSYLRARRALDLPGDVPDTEARLAELVVTADTEALADLRDRVLAPLADLTPSTRDKLVDTLRAWLVHQGRRSAVAEALFVHPQTVRYRVGQLREAYGDLLDDPVFVRDASVALAAHG